MTRGATLARRSLSRQGPGGEIRRLGENRTGRLDLRLVAASNRSLDAGAVAGRFRRDLLYGLGVVRLAAPPLRGRGPDIGRLTVHNWKDIAPVAGSRASPARETLTALSGYPWPGTSGLHNVLANLTVTGPRYSPVGPEALPRGGRSRRTDVRARRWP